MKFKRNIRLAWWWLTARWKYQHAILFYRAWDKISEEDKKEMGKMMWDAAIEMLKRDNEKKEKEVLVSH